MKQSFQPMSSLKTSMGEIEAALPTGQREQMPEALSGKNHRRASRTTLEAWTHYLYIVPIFVFIIGFVYIAIIYTTYVSTLDWDGLSPERTFVGLKNYVMIFQDPIFYLTLKNTVIFAILTIGIQMLFGLVLAVMLQARVKLKVVYKIIFFLPSVLASSVVAYVFRHIYDGNVGELNQFLTALHLTSLTYSWLADPRVALYAIAIINIWQWTGFSFIMYSAALTLIDESIYEAARIDGANAFQIIWRITFPLLRPTNFSLIILGVIGSLKTFDVVWLTTGGGPGRATEFLSTYIYKKMVLEYNAGYSSALSIMLLLLALVITVFQLRAYRGQGAANV